MAQHSNKVSLTQGDKDEQRIAPGIPSVSPGARLQANQRAVRRPSEADSQISTAALVSDAPSDAVYTSLENKLEAWRDQRNALASKIRDILEGAAFSNQGISDDQAADLIEKANALLDQIRACAANTAACSK